MLDLQSVIFGAVLCGSDEDIGNLHGVVQKEVDLRFKYRDYCLFKLWAVGMLSKDEYKNAKSN
jgi:hypothetical protein